MKNKLNAHIKNQILWILVACVMLIMSSCSPSSPEGTVSPTPGSTQVVEPPSLAPESEPPSEPVPAIQAGLVLYMAVDGNDLSSGTIDEPLASFEGARDHIRAIRKTTGIPEGGIIVSIRGGVYPITVTTDFTEEDSGLADRPIAYMAYPGEKPIFNGGVSIPGTEFHSVSDAAILSRLLYGDSKDKVVEYDLFANGFSPSDLDTSQDFWADGNLKEFATEETREIDFLTKRMQVFVDDEALYLARWPNKVEGIFEENPYDAYLGLGNEVISSGFNDKTEKRDGSKSIFKTYERRILNWQSFDDVIVFGMLGWEFFHDRIVVENINRDTMAITLRTVPSSGLQYESGRQSRYAFENVLEELDTPGEYYIHSQTGMLYLYPPRDITSATVKVSKFNGNYIIRLQDASFLNFVGLTFELTKGSGINIQAGDHCTIQNCVFQDIGVYGVNIGEGIWSSRDIAAETLENGGQVPEEVLLSTTKRNGTNHSVLDSVFLNIGFCATRIRVGDTYTRERAFVIFEGNLVKHTGLLGSAYFSGVSVDGVGVIIKNNEFAYSRGQAIAGNIIDCDIIYNEFYDCPSDMAEDTCTIYLNYMGINDGVQVRYNYFHDVTARDCRAIGFDTRRRSGVGYDNDAPFNDFSYNVVYNMQGGSGIRTVGPSTYINNIFIDSMNPLGDMRELMEEVLDKMTVKDLIDSTNHSSLYYLYQSGLWQTEPWQNTYPELCEYFAYLEKNPSLQHTMSTVENNLVVFLREKPSGRYNYFPIGTMTDAVYGFNEPPIQIDHDPGFADFAGYDFQLSPETAKAFGMEWLDMSKIGLPDSTKPTRNVIPGDPLHDARKTANFEPWLKSTDGSLPQAGRMISLWREVLPGVWQWQDDSIVNSEGSSGLDCLPGGTYTVWFEGDRFHPAQFVGGVPGVYPTDQVEKFTVPADTFYTGYNPVYFDFTIVPYDD
jgi:hypothetical protein